MSKSPTLREQIATLREELEALRAASPSVAVEAPSGNGFVAFLTAKHERDLKAGTHVRCEQPGCSGVMNVARTTRIKGRRACRRHF